MNGYVAFYKGKRIEVRAETLLKARDLAAAQFKARKAFEVNIILAEIDNKPVVHVATA